MSHDESLGAVLLQRPMGGDRYSTEWTFAHQVRDSPSGESHDGGRLKDLGTGIPPTIDGRHPRLPRPLRRNWSLGVST
jgi:hypothetical protein